MLKESLERRGVLGQLKARIRAEVFNALDDEVNIHFGRKQLAIFFLFY